MVSITKYMQLSEAYRKRENELSALIKEEGVLLGQKAQLQIRLESLVNKLSRRDAEIMIWRACNDPSFLMKNTE
jgi:hypothetical protein